MTKVSFGEPVWLARLQYVDWQIGISRRLPRWPRRPVQNTKLDRQTSCPVEQIWKLTVTPIPLIIELLTLLKYKIHLYFLVENINEITDSMKSSVLLKMILRWLLNRWMFARKCLRGISIHYNWKVFIDLKGGLFWGLFDHKNLKQ